MKILLIRLSSMGDILLTQPIVAELRERHPQAEIHYLCKAVYRDLVSLLGDDIQIIEYDKSLLWHIRMMRRYYDIIIDLHGKISSILLKYIIQAPVKLSYNKQHSLRKRISRGDRTSSIESTVRLYYSALGKWKPEVYGEQHPLRKPILRLPPQATKLSLPDRDISKKLLGIFPGAAHPTKIYPAGQWRDFIAMVKDRYQVWLLGSNEESALAESIAAGYPSEVANLCGNFGFIELAQVMSGCDLIISGDSGPMHLAAGLGIPQIAIFGATHPRLGFAPMNDQATVLSLDLDCQPCSLHGSQRCPLGHFNCMKQLSPQLLAAHCP